MTIPEFTGFPKIERGSSAAPGFMNPEGIVVFHTVAQWLLKKTIDKDDQPKGQQ